MSLRRSVPEHTWKPERFTGVIFDVGMNETDTAFYLHQGYAVLAIEADPLLVTRGAERFSGAIEAGQLHVLNVGISDRTGHAPFWICDDKSGWSSFDKEIASRNGSKHHSVDIETWRFADVLEIVVDEGRFRACGYLIRCSLIQGLCLRVRGGPSS